MSQKILTFLTNIIIAGTFISIPVSYAETQTFSDIPNDHPNKTAIEYLKNNNVLKGYEDGQYRPDNAVNRAELLKILIEGSGYKVSEPDKDCFPDVKKDQWFSKYICFAKEKKWIKGYQDGYFRPEQTVSKVEALKILGEIQNWDFAEAVDSNFSDVNYQEWYGPYLQYAETKGLIPENAKKFNPDKGMTRAEIAENIFRTIAVKQLKEIKFTEDIISKVISTKIQPPIKPTVLINEIQYGYNDFSSIELFNSGNENINLKDWSITNSELQKLVTLPEIILGPKSYLTLDFYLGSGQNDTDLNDGKGKYYLDTGILRENEDNVALFNTSIPSENSLVDFVAYCNTKNCSKGLTYNIALSAEQWLNNNFISFFETPENGQFIIKRDKNSHDINAASDWTYYTDDEKNYDFDDISPEPFDFSQIELLARNKTIVASTQLLAKECDYTEVLKKAIQMLKDSCLEEDLLNEDIAKIDPSALKGEDIKSKFMHGDKKKVKKVALGSGIEVHMASGSANKRGETYPPESIDDTVVIEINTDKVDCDPEKMKAVLFHELIHEKQFRQKGTGFWDKDGNRVGPIGKDWHKDYNTQDPRTMIADCAEVEAHLRTAQCMQKEQKLEAFKDYKKSIKEMLNTSKSQTEKYANNGPNGDDDEQDPVRQGCLNYINHIKNNISNKGKEIKNPDWLKENKKIWDDYLHSWLEKLQQLSYIMYEKYYYKDGSSEKERDQIKEIFKKWAKESLYMTEEQIDKMITKALNFIAANDTSAPKEEKTTNPNQSPISIITPSSPSCVKDEIVYLNGEESYDQDGTITNYQWYYNEMLYSTNYTAGFECKDIGTKKIELRVTDNQEAIASSNVTLTINPPIVNTETTNNNKPTENTKTGTTTSNQAPVASIYPASPGCTTGGTISISAAESYDPDGTIAEYRWYMSNSTLLSTAKSFTYDCMSPGNKAMKLEIIDDKGLSANYNFTIIVN